MTLEEAIKHAEDQAKVCRNSIDVLERNGLPNAAKKQRECAEEHEQLADWLKELKEYRKKDESDGKRRACNI